MDSLQIFAAETALRKMLKDGHFSICTVDNILKMTNVVPNARAYQILRLLHCVNFSDMPPEVQREMPDLLRDVLGGAEIDLASALNPESKRELCVVDGGKSGGTWLSRMIRQP